MCQYAVVPVVGTLANKGNTYMAQANTKPAQAAPAPAPAATVQAVPTPAVGHTVGKYIAAHALWQAAPNYTRSIGGNNAVYMQAIQACLQANGGKATTAQLVQAGASAGNARYANYIAQGNPATRGKPYLVPATK